MIEKYKGTYRIKAPYDLTKNQFPRKLDGTYEDIDCYIECDKNVKIFSLGRGVLQAYIPALKQGRNVLRNIYCDHINKSNTNTITNSYEVERDGKIIPVTKETISIIDEGLFNKEINNSSLIFNIVETDEEVLFDFNAKNIDILKQYLNPRTNGSNISPFSNKNLPKSKYSIPEVDLNGYKGISSKLEQGQLILLAKYTTSFLQSLATKKNTWENIKADMVLKGLKGKEYIHSIGEWKAYIKYLQEHLE